ncbi:MAG: AtpZ/AtpI family protein [Candidatus Acidiferrales bacterium]
MDNKPTETGPHLPSTGKGRSVANQAALAMELPFTLAGALAVGVALGYFLDRWLHTKPILMLVLGALGFAAGVREVLRRVPGNGDGKP